MDLKNVDLDMLRTSLQRTGTVLKEELDKDLAKSLERLEAAISTVRLLDKLPAGELIQRATLAEVIPLFFPPRTPRVPVEKASFRAELQARAYLAFEDGYSQGLNEYINVPQYQGQLARPPMVKTGTNYRLLVFLVEQ